MIRDEFLEGTLYSSFAEINKLYVKIIVHICNEE